jgi:predicted CoA-binding protein
MKEAIERFVQSRQIAIVGASGSPRKFSGNVVRALREKGYQIFAVNPNREAINRERCYKDLRELPPSVEAALFVLPSYAAADMVKEASASGIRRIWFQQGGNYCDAAALATQAGIETITGKCILMYAPPVTSIHAFHRFVARLFRLA